ncbi:uncharacterized protein LOC112203766 [Rosa chinensis]|uniref:uncharacterized protein LOC112203766 n=1 Tax=Rosa chinensis TaxID=74649 RepID=UPI000D08EE89|nr:uncharacterized protein LOC112203766 [Rosa chinensis]
MGKQNYLANLLGVQRVDKHERYLGLPTYVGRSKTAAFNYLKEKLTKKVISWRATLLSGAELGDHPSFPWRSVWEARDVLMKGVRWQVRNGEDIDIWRDNWLFDSFPSSPCSPQPGDAPTKVSELILPGSRTWDEDKIAQWFASVDRELILKIPLSQHAPRDSAYYMARDISLGLVLAFPSIPDPYTRLWAALWKATVPNKVALQAWRSCVNILPTRHCLSTKGYVGDMVCPLCGSGIENNVHLFIHCNYAREVWAAANLPVPSMHVFVVKDYLLQLVGILSTEHFGKVLILLWAIWKNRNTQVWEGTKQHPCDAMLMAFGWLTEFQKANSCEKQSRVQRQG